jgi:hypothetical protein
MTITSAFRKDAYVHDSAIYAGPVGQNTRRDAMTAGKGFRRDGTEVDVEGLLQRVELTEKALVNAMEENAKLRAALHGAKATGAKATGDVSRIDPAVLDSRHATRADADDYDPRERMNARLSNAWRHPPAQTHTDSVQANSATDDEDYDPAERMAQRLSHGRSR